MEEIKPGFQSGKLTAVREATEDERAGGKPSWVCTCECGKEHVVQRHHLAHRRIKSCGCVWTKHGAYVGRERATPEYAAWCSMKQRCENPKSKSWKNYGARGIRVAKEWSESFEAFLAAVGPRPSPQHSLDRFPNNDGNYEPGNVRWATLLEQHQNTRRNVKLTSGGETLTLSEWTRRLGLSENTIRERLRRGWTVQEALSPR